MKLIAPIAALLLGIPTAFAGLAPIETVTPGTIIEIGDARVLNTTGCWMQTVDRNGAATSQFATLPLKGGWIEIQSASFSCTDDKLEVASNVSATIIPPQ